MNIIATARKREGDLIPFQRWLDELGLSAVTGWRWRKRGYVTTVNISGRNYISQDAIRKFEDRASNGEFSAVSPWSKQQSKAQAGAQGRNDNSGN